MIFHMCGIVKSNVIMQHFEKQLAFTKVLLKFTVKIATNKQNQKIFLKMFIRTTDIYKQIKQCKMLLKRNAFWAEFSNMNGSDGCDGGGDRVQELLIQNPFSFNLDCATDVSVWSDNLRYLQLDRGHESSAMDKAGRPVQASWHKSPITSFRSLSRDIEERPAQGEMWSLFFVPVNSRDGS